MSIVRKIAALTGILMLVTSITAETYSDVAEKSVYSEEIEKIVALGIMNGYPDGTFRPDTGISRAEAAVMFSGILRLNAESSSSRFYDVPEDYWAKGEIEAAAAFGIVNGTSDGAFLPDVGLERLQAAVILLNVMGFKNEAAFYGGYPSGYMKLAYDKGIFSKIKGSVTDVITRGEMAAMLSNALDTRIMESNPNKGMKLSNETLLTGILGFGKTDGQVTETEKTALTSPEHLSAGKVRIDGEIYNKGGTCIENEIGRNVRLYYKEDSDGNRTIIYFELKKNYKELTITANQLEDFADKRVTYRINEKSGIKYAEISETADVIFNGRYKTAQKEDFLPKEGKIVLYDSDNDTVFDVVIITSYVTYIVDSVNITDGRIYDKYGGKYIDLSDAPDKYVIIESDSAYVGIEDIQEDDVLSIAADGVEYTDGYPCIEETSEVYEIKVSKKSVSGTVTGVNDEKIVIDEQEYDISEAYKNMTVKNRMAEVKCGDSGMFYIDFFGKFAGLNRDDRFAVQGNYAFVVSCRITEEDDGMKLRAFDFNLNDITDFKCAGKVSIDKKTYKCGEDMLRAMCTQYSGIVTEEFAPRLIVYKTDGEGKINRIDTDYVSEGESKTNSLRYDDNQAVRYCSGGCFGGDIVMGNSSRVLAVPRLRAPLAKTFAGSSKTFIADTSLNEYIYFRKPTSFTSTSTRYTTETYNIEKSGEAGLIIYYYNPIKSSSQINYQRYQTMMIEKVRKIYIDDEYGYEIRGICGNKVIDLFLTDELSEVADVKMKDGEAVAVKKDVSELKRGDIIRYSDLKQNTNVTVRVERIYSPDSDAEYSEEFYSLKNTNETMDKNAYFRAFNAAYGILKTAKNNIVKIDFSSGTEEKGGYAYNLSSMTVNLYDNGDIREAKAGELLSLDNTGNAAYAAKIIAVTQNGTLRAVYAYQK